ncbi:THAP domain-containing protein 2 [Austrofundulus limnaeus]|uniref:THAP domain-containing protein 2 n=1 Tax=Austrofundulus limnaeus TaxID=52670 RepID=A0A2I4CTT7_AUSLI|nr:PREDICTED: THAP domain-containing protein 2-like [Austrofundulus limnaeus]
MPDFCAAYRCSNSRSIKTRSRGITFHLFPKNRERRQQWEAAVRREGFVASERTLLCSEHFRPEDFDRTGQTVRLRDGVVPTLFSSPAHLQTLEASRNTSCSTDELPLDLSKKRPESDILPKHQDAAEVQSTDHSYALPTSPEALYAKLKEATDRVRKLEREKSIALARERRARKNCLIFVIREDCHTDMHDVINKTNP